MVAKYRTKRILTKKKYIRKRRMRLLLILSLFVAILVALGVAGSVWGKGLAKYLPFLKKEEKGPVFTQPRERVTFLVIGLDEEDPSKKADTLMVVTYDPKKQALDLISIPKNTLVEIPGYNVGEVSQAFSYGRVSLSMATVEYLLGVDINHYLEIDKKGLKGLVDKLGGVTISSKRRSGDQAVKYVSPTSSVEKEVDRVERQHKFMAALFKKVKEKKVYGRLPSIAKSLKRSVGTDFTDKDIANLPLVFGAVKENKVNLRILPVTEVMMNNKVYYQVNKERVEALVAKIFGSELTKKEGRASFRIRVLNGVGEPGVANEVTKKLIDSGYKVIDTKNADNFDYAETQLIIYSNKPQNLAMVNRVKSLLGVGKIVINNLPQDVADLTIIIGKDYRTQVYVPQKKIEVLNGSGRSGVAASAGNKLSNAGYTVVRTEDADRSDYDKTKLILYVDNQPVREIAEDIKSILGAGEIAVSAVTRSDVEISVIIGKDY